MRFRHLLLAALAVGLCSTAALAQGHLEGSNVNPIDTLVAMIAAQMAFEVQSKVMTTEDEMLEKSVNNLPRVGG